MYRLVAVILSIFLLVSPLQGLNGPWFNIISYRTGLTLSTTFPNNATFTALTLNNDYQSWTRDVNGRLVNKANPLMVLDVYNNAASSGNTVITFRAKNSSATSSAAVKNQLWMLLSNGTVQSGISTNPNFYLKNFNQFAVISSLLPPQVFNFTEPWISPTTCIAYGDPHFTRFNGSSFDFQGKGVFLLNSWGNNIVQSSQEVCSGGITCIKQVAIKASGYSSTIIISNSGVTVGGTPLAVSGTVKLSNIVSITKTGPTFPITYKVSMNNSFLVYTVFAASSTVQITLTAGAVPDGGVCSDFCPKNTTTHQCGLTSLVTPANSLFPSSATNNNDASYEPAALPTSTNDASLQATAACACQSLAPSNDVCSTLANVCNAYAGASVFYSSCAGDIYQTGNAEFGQVSANAFASLCVYNAQQQGASVVLPVSGFTSIASGPGLSDSVTSSQPITFTIQAQDDLGRTISKGGDAFSVTSTGSSSLTFNIVDNNDGTYTVSYVPAVGTYQISVKRCCNNLPGSPFTVNVVSQCSASATQSNLLCNGDGTGSLTITGNGGRKPYQYSYGSSGYVSSGTFTGLQAGSYSWSFKDNNGCTASGSVTITQPPVLSVTATKSDLSCYSDNSGSFSLAVTGGVADYTYSVNGGGYASSNTWSGLAAGGYTWMVKDADACSISGTVLISQPDALVLSVVSEYDETCYGQSVGNFSVSATGGTPPYSYSNGAGWQQSGSYQQLPVGSYNPQVVDTASCAASVSVSVSQPSALTASTSVVSVACYGSSSGSFTVFPTGGVGSYMYSADGVNYGSPNTFESLQAGDYTYYVTDANGCVFTGTVTVSQPSGALAGVSTVSNVQCNGASTGSIAVTASGGSSGYKYSVNDGTFGDGSTFADLPAGTYSYVIQDKNACVFRGSATVTQPTVLSLSVSSKTDVTCYGGSNANFALSGSGGVSPYVYSIGSSFSSNNVFSNQAAGSYNAQIQDQNGCSAMLSVAVTQPGAVQVSAVAAPVNCFGGQSGTVTIANQGGVSPFTYSLNGGASQSSNAFRNLTAGTYTYTATDSNMCSASSSVTITQPTSALSGNSTQVNVACRGSSTGSLSVTTTGGTGPYTYSVDGGAYGSSNIFNGLAAGSHSWSVQDNKQCTFSSSSVINQPAIGLTLGSSIVNNAACFNGTGNFTLAATGGNTPYSYTTGTVFASNNVFTNQQAGTYTAKVQDANQCIVSLAVQVKQPAAITVSTPSITHVACRGAKTGAFTLLANGGSSTYTYAIGGPVGASGSSGAFSSLPAGSYSWSIRDSNSCSASGTQAISQPTTVLALTTNVTTACTSSGVANINAFGSGGSGSYMYSIGGAYQSGSVFSNVMPGTYNVTVKDSNGCVVASTAYASSSACAEVHVPCIVWGDPHFIRFDSTKFDFQAVGDFVLAEWNGNKIQIRQQECSKGVTCNKAIAVQPSGMSSVIIVNLNAVITVGGNVVTVNSGATAQVASGVTISSTVQTNSYLISFNGATVAFNWYNGSPSFVIMFPYGAGSSVTAGLCSSVGGAPNTTWSESWRVQSESVSLFTYSASETYSSVNQPNYAGNYGPYSTDNSTLSNIAATLCAPLTSSGSLAKNCNSYASSSGWYSTCYGDVVATGDVTKAQATVSAYVIICNSLATAKIAFPTASASSVVSGAGLTTKLMYPSTYTPRVFTIQTYDAIGNAVANSDSFTFTTTSGPTQLSFSVVAGSGGLYTITYSVPNPGVYNFTISLRGYEVVGSAQYQITADYSAPFTIMTAAGKALTYTSGSTVLFDTPQVGNASQVWQMMGGRIVLKSQNLTLDVNGNSTTAGTSIIAWMMKNSLNGSPNLNQFWSMFTNGTIASNLAPAYFSKVVGTSFVTSYASPPYSFYYQIPW